RMAKGHRTAAGVEAHADVPRRRNLALDVVAIFKNVTVVYDCGVAGNGRVRPPNEGAGAGGLLGRACPDAVLGLKPREEIVVLCGGQVACEGLVEMVMRVDEPWQDDLAGEVNHRVRIGREFLIWAHLFDKAVLRVD